MQALLWVHTISTFSMFVLIVLVQVVIYPQFSAVGKTELQDYSRQHMKRISYVVIPIMLIEMASLIYLATQIPISNSYLSISILSLSLIWGLTFLKIVPIHNQIESRALQDKIPTLIRLNLYRTLLWTVKMVASIGLLLH